ncbi:MAG: phage-shock protein [Desulfatiglandales bacterium]
MMHGLTVLAIAFGGSVLLLAIIASTILMALKILKGGVSRKGREHDSEEARMIQEIYQGLSRMEERVDALETIILDCKRKGHKS